MTLVLNSYENLTIEFKSDKSKLPDSDLIDAIVAFANTNGGSLYLGIEDDGEITGLHNSHQDITQLAAFIANKTKKIPNSNKLWGIRYISDKHINMNVMPV